MERFRGKRYKMKLPEGATLILYYCSVCDLEFALSELDMYSHLPEHTDPETGESCEGSKDLPSMLYRAPNGDLIPVIYCQ